jgi:aldose 1-epimerase
MSRIIELASGAARVRIAPAAGGAIMSFTWCDRPVLRPTAEAAADVRRSACYPLVPWSNRIRDAHLVFGGRDYTLARNFSTHPHAIHGVGWQRPWSVAEALPRRARLVLEHDARETNAEAWPWSFRATQTFALTSRDAAPRSALLAMTLTLENAASEPFPFGLGWHPFFPKDAATALGFDARAVWQNDATQLPQRRIDVPPPQ